MPLKGVKFRVVQHQRSTITTLWKSKIIANIYVKNFLRVILRLREY